MRKIRKLIMLLLALGLVLTLAFSVYVNDYYKAVSKQTAPSVLVNYDRDIVIRPVNHDLGIGIAFYPGAKVASDAYIELLAPLSELGYTVVIAQMPYHLAVLDSNRMSRIITSHPEIKNWYLGGHSLGAAMAGKYVSANPESVKGLFLLAGYSSSDLSQFPGEVISIQGERDTIINKNKILKNNKNIPASTLHITLPGANHAQFGTYGSQKGDGLALIPANHQQALAREYILKMLNQSES